MQKTYNPEDIEMKLAATWEKNGYFKPNAEGTPYTIALPPPNVTGTLHMGHGFQCSLMDALIRRARMQGKNTLWQPGTDHAGIATQMVVERQLASQQKTRHDLGRDVFIKKVWEWREHSGSTITHQLRRLGASLDWSRLRFSMDESMTQATYTAFIRLYEEGLIYRGKRLVNWDPALHTAISDLEVENKEQKGHLWHIRYPLSDGSTHLVVATTRPETMLGDSAVAVHPEDARYQHLIGKTITLPFTERKIPIIADDYVDRQFGSGCVKITPAHDFNDYEMAQRHQLPLINILTFEAHLNETVPAPYRGLERFAARKKIIADLDAQGLLEKIEEHTNTVPYGDRSGVVLEPMLTDQWYVKTEILAKPAIDAVQQGSLKFVPENWTKTYLQWLENIQDWCISRQLWWGHRIPVWYDEEGHTYVGFDEADARQRNQLVDTLTLRQDEDVLDTWFTAALWPFASLGWPEDTNTYKTYYPTNVLVTGFDIIFFWVARMVMMGLYFLGEVPFKEVYITGLIRDSHGQKMSKSKGNILDPIDLIDGITLEPLIKKRTQGLMQPKMAEKIAKQTAQEFPKGISAHGTDALRFTFCSLATTGRDINFDLGRIEGYRNFCNKLWNAARFVWMNVDNVTLKNPNINTVANNWINTVFQHTIKTVNEYFDRYRFDLVAQALYEFTWNHYCDWYLELAKATLNSTESSDDEKDATHYTLVYILEQLLRLMHPLMPFITEEIWQTVSPLLLPEKNTHEKTIMLQAYPSFDASQVNDESLIEMTWLQSMITAIRNIRSELNLSPAKTIALILSKGSLDDKERFTKFTLYFAALTKVTDVRWADEESSIPLSASAVVNGLELYIPLAGLINTELELTRLSKEIQKLKIECTKCEQKLNNPGYVEKAPEDVVQKERERLVQHNDALQKLTTYYQRIQALR